jgi:hypothetical protein
MYVGPCMLGIFDGEGFDIVGPDTAEFDRTRQDSDADSSSDTGLIDGVHERRNYSLSFGGQGEYHCVPV